MQVISAGLLKFAISVRMSRDRFLALLTMLKLNNNNAKSARGQPGYDPQSKIWPVIDTSQNFRTFTQRKNN
jgi:hypothetical protein